jgi:hypothetical protein
MPSQTVFSPMCRDSVFRFSGSPAALELFPDIDTQGTHSLQSRSWNGKLRCWIHGGGNWPGPYAGSEFDISLAQQDARPRIDMQGCVTELTGFPKRVKLDGPRPSPVGCLNRLCQCSRSTVRMSVLHSVLVCVDDFKARFRCVEVGCLFSSSTPYPRGSSSVSCPNLLLSFRPFSNPLCFPHSSRPLFFPFMLVLSPKSVLDIVFLQHSMVRLGSLLSRPSMPQSATVKPRAQTLRLGPLNLSEEEP